MIFAQSYAAAFPNLRCLEFFSHGHGSHVIPSRFDRIERALHTCTNADQIDLDFCVVSCVENQCVGCTRQFFTKSLLSWR